MDSEFRDTEMILSLPASSKAVLASADPTSFLCSFPSQALPTLHSDIEAGMAVQ